jgi:hypothetical protein
MRKCHRAEGEFPCLLAKVGKPSASPQTKINRARHGLAVPLAIWQKLELEGLAGGIKKPTVAARSASIHNRRIARFRNLDRHVTPDAFL